MANLFKEITTFLSGTPAQALLVLLSFLPSQASLGKKGNSMICRFLLLKIYFILARMPES
jgi:hypothetical protein